MSPFLALDPTYQPPVTRFLQTNSWLCMEAKVSCLFNPAWLFLLFAATNSLRWLLQRRKVGYLQLHQVRLTQEIAALRKEAEALNAPATFAQSAKFTRLANAKEKELGALQDGGTHALHDRIDLVLFLVKALVFAGALAACWGEAVMYVPPQLTWPLGNALALPHGVARLGAGAITVVPWMALCDRVSTTLARVAFPNPTLALRTRSSPLLPEGKDL